MTRAWKRALTVVAVPTLAFLVGMFAWTGTASAHNVSNIDADCTHVTVHFNNFPDAGVMVHIVAAVEGHAAISTDVLVKNDMSADVNISAATGLLFGASADVDVDVTWTLNGAQHEHEKLTVTCGSSTTTTKQATTTTVAGGGTTTTTSGSGGTTTTVASGGTTTTVASGGTTSTTVAGSGGGSTTTTVAGSVDVDDNTTGGGDTDVSGDGTVSAGGTGTTDNGVAVLGETATAGSSTLPRTGSTTGPLLAFAAIAIVCGLGGVIGARRHLAS